MKKRWSSGAPVHVLHCFSTAAAAAAAAAVGGAASFCAYSLQNFLFHFPFDEIYRRLIFFHSRAFCFRVNRLFHN